jgi:ribonuclease P protein component
VVFFLPQSEKKVGFTATKRIGNAVKRNRAKRVLRALFIGVCDQLASGAYVFVAKESIVDANFGTLTKTLQKSLRKMKAYAE